MVHHLLLTLLLAPPVLVEHLGNDSFPTREQTSRTLFALGPFAVAPLRTGLRSEDLEIQRRCQRLLARNLARDEAALLAQIGGKWPYIDSMPLGHPDRLGSHYVRFLALAGGASDVRPWPCYRLATGLMVREMISEGRRAEALTLLGVMQTREAELIAAQTQQPDDEGGP